MNDETTDVRIEHGCRQPDPESDTAAPPPPWNPMSRIEFERLFGGRVLAWIGGLATLLGVVFLMGSARRQQLDHEEIRTLLASSAPSCCSAGVWLYERKGRTEAARIAVAVAIPGSIRDAPGRHPGLRPDLARARPRGARR